MVCPRFILQRVHHASMSLPTFQAVAMGRRTLNHNAAKVRADSRDDLVIDGLRPDRELVRGHLLVAVAAEQGGLDRAFALRRPRAERRVSLLAQRPYREIPIRTASCRAWGNSSAAALAAMCRSREPAPSAARTRRAPSSNAESCWPA